MNEDDINITEIEDFVTFGYPRLKIAKGVYGRLIQLQNDDFELVISVTEGLRAEALKDAWGNISEFRERLRKTQGSDIRDYSISLYLTLTYLKDNGWSYSEIARALNLDCMSLLCQCVDGKKEGDADQSNPLVHYYSTLTSMGMSKDESLDLFLEGMELVRSNQAPWYPEDQPIKGIRVRDFLRQFNKNIKKGTIVLLDEEVDIRLPIIYRWIILITPKYIIKALNLINITHPEMKDKMTNDFHKRANVINQILDNFG